MDIALNKQTGDLAMPVQLVTGPAYTRQAVNIRLRFFQGDWFLDQVAGLPYYQQIFKKNRNAKAAIDALIMNEILKTPSVNGFVKTVDLPLGFSSTLINRAYACQFIADTDFGQVEMSWQA